MPEGDAVWRTARRLHDALAGAVLLGSDLRVPSLATTDLADRRTLEVLPHGKHLLHRIEGGLTLHSHLRMDGSWRVVPAGAHAAAGRRHTVRALLWTDQVLAVGDQLGMLDLVRSQDERALVGHLGPDLLDPAFQAATALANLSSVPGRPVAEALLDQRNLAGIGTIYASEPLFEHRIGPWTPVGRLTADQLAAVVDTARRQMVTSARAGLAAPTELAGARGATWGFQRSVFGRNGLPCRRCGATVRQGTVGEPPRERVLSFCPSCQGGAGR